MTMTVTVGCMIFSASPPWLQAVITAIAYAAANCVTPGMVSVTPICPTPRRLTVADVKDADVETTVSRRLSTTVNLAYAVTIPAGSTVSAANVANSLSAVTPATLTNMIQAEMMKRGLTGGIQ